MFLPYAILITLDRHPPFIHWKVIARSLRIRAGCRRSYLHNYGGREVSMQRQAARYRHRRSTEESNPDRTDSSIVLMSLNCPTRNRPGRLFTGLARIELEFDGILHCSRVFRRNRYRYQLTESGWVCRYYSNIFDPIFTRCSPWWWVCWRWRLS